MTSTEWTYGASHPHTWQLPDITLNLVAKLRKSKYAKSQDGRPCGSREAIRTAGLIFSDGANTTAVHSYHHSSNRLLLQDLEARSASVIYHLYRISLGKIMLRGYCNTRCSMSLINACSLVNSPSNNTAQII